MIVKEVFIMKKNYNHSKEFWNKAYKDYKREVKKIGGFVLKKDAFKSAYNALKEEYAKKSKDSKNIKKDLIYASKYGTKYKTALAEYRSLKNLGIKGIKFEDFKLMTTQDFVATYSTQLEDAYRNLRAKGMTKKDAADEISAQWFGSK